jgi:sucrose-6F-phosphate phosphohydrolase
MKNVTNPTRLLFASDVDDTLLGNNDTLAELSGALETARGHLILAYNSSRPCASLRKSIAEETKLPQPDYLIGALGTEIQHFASGETFPSHVRQLEKGWDRKRVAEVMNGLGFSAHANEYQTSFKVSYDVLGASQHQQAIEELEKTGLNIKVIYSGSKNLDVIPANAGKGKAVDFLRVMKSLRAEQVIVAGDSANDREMFLYSFKGIVVANADTSLKTLSGDHIYHAGKSYAAGVLEGLRHWEAL